MYDKIVVLIIFILCYSLAILRKFKLAYISLVSAGLLLILGSISPLEAFSSIKWDVLGIYWGFMMISMVFAESQMPKLIAFKIIKHVKKEKYVIFWLCAIAAFLSAFMENVGVVLMLAPVAIEAARKLKSKIFNYLIAIAISSNIVTTITMVADPPSILLAIETGMKFFDFYWFQGKISLGTITFLGVVVALGSLLIIFKKLNNKIDYEENEKINVDYIPTILFILGVFALAFLPDQGIRPGIVGLTGGGIALGLYLKNAKKMMKDFDWNSFFFIVGIFIVIGSLKSTGLLDSFANFIGTIGIKNVPLMIVIFVLISVLASSFIDNVPWTILMIPVCTQVAQMLNISAVPLLFGMLIGTGMGGNITPIGATANVFACGILEKEGYKIKIKEYLKISLPFTLTAVLVSTLVLILVWV